MVSGTGTHARGGLSFQQRRLCFDFDFSVKLTLTRWKLGMGLGGPLGGYIADK